MKIDHNVKYDFSDVLLIPKRSELNSRSEVNLERTMIFKHSRYQWTGVPIIVANMDTTGTVEMARALEKFKVITCLHKYHKWEDIPEDLNKDYYAVSTGIGEADLKNLDEIMEHRDPTFICIDVANGYASRFLQVIKEIRKKYPGKTLMGGNIVTREMTEELIINGGLDVVKVGIGSGCFTSDTLLMMADRNFKNINQVNPGERVINMEGKPVTVLNRLNQGYRKVVAVTTSNWRLPFYVTPDHLFWVKDGDQYKWVQISDITSEMSILLPNGLGGYIYSQVVKQEPVDELQETWDIEVNCPTHSFIANNCIVHNSVCTTRLKTGVGYPQFSAVAECADSAHGLDGHIISDGGIQVVGDFSKAFGAGADFVMAGSMFAGHTESAGELVEEGGQMYKLFYGMSSAEAMHKYHGGIANYRSAEGKTVRIKYKGPVKETITDILGGIRSTMTYIGAKSLKNIPKCASFITVNHQVNNLYS